MMGPEGLQRASEDAVLNANYLFARLKDYFDVPYPRICKHEFVLSAKSYKEKHGVSDLGYGQAAPRLRVPRADGHFPLIVEEALMIEPTETETKETLDEFVEAMIEICEEAKRDPETVKTAPHTTPVGRLDETRRRGSWTLGGGRARERPVAPPRRRAGSSFLEHGRG